MLRRDHETYQSFRWKITTNWKEKKQKISGKTSTCICTIQLELLQILRGVDKMVIWDRIILITRTNIKIKCHWKGILVGSLVYECTNVYFHTATHWIITSIHTCYNHQVAKFARKTTLNKLSNLFFLYARQAYFI